MSDRYEIEEMVEQDASGVVFRVRNREDDGVAALRRFFPSGAPGEGFLKEEAEAFRGTVEALRSVRHPSLCGVLDGAVDEVDGIPYLVMEWAGGESLAKLLEKGPLGAEQAVAVAGQGLEVLILLAGVFGPESAWLEMEAGSVAVCPEEGICRFRICPFQVLGMGRRDGGVKGLGFLVEHLMGWSGQVVPPGAAAGLGGWVAKAKEGAWGLGEAMNALIRVRSAWTGEAVPEQRAVQAPSAAPQRVTKPVMPQIYHPAPKRSAAGMWAAMILVGGVLLGVGIWLGVKQPWAAPVVTKTEPVRVAKESAAKGPKRGAPKPAAAELTAQEKIDRMVREATAALEKEGGKKAPVGKPGRPGPVVDNEPPAPAEEVPEEEVPEEDWATRIFGPADGALMRNRIGSEGVLEGKLFRVRDSSSGKTRYLEFSEEAGQDVVCVRFWAQSAPAMEDLEGLVGKTLKFTGTIEVEAGTGRIVLHLDELAQIEEL